MPWPIWAFLRRISRLWRRSNDDVVHFDEDDRAKQLREFAALCEALEDGFARNGETRAADLIGPLHRKARQLLDEGWEQVDLNELGGRYPAQPVAWLHPRMADYQMPREEWQDEVAELNSRARALSVDLRSIGYRTG